MQDNTKPWLITLLVALSCVMGARTVVPQNVVASEISVGNLTSNVKNWRKDMAVMFYAPWCQYCKQLKPSWDQIAKISEPNENLQVGIFDCDSDTSNTEVCQALGVDRYPSIYFVGYGDFNQAKPGNMLVKTELPRIVRYNADLYPEHILDWMQMLARISAVQRGIDNIKGFFSKNSGMRRQIEDLHEELVTSEYRIKLYANELERYKADEIFHELQDNGDPSLYLRNLM